MGDRAYILLKKKYSARMIAMCCRLSELRTQLEECQSGAGGGEVSIEINGLAFGIFECGTTVDVPVVDSMDLPIDGLTIEAGKVIIPDCPVPDDAEVRINTSFFKFVPSGEMLDITVEYENGIPVGDLEIPDNKIIIPDIVTSTPASNSDDTYVTTVTTGVPKELPDVIMTQPNGSTTSYPSVKDFTCTPIGSLADSDLISQITDPQLVALYDGRININVIEFTTVGFDNYSKPSNLLWVDVICVGGGGGGASGQRRAGPTASQGGAGGGFAAIARRRISASLLASTETITVGSGGAGGTVQTSDNGTQRGGSTGGSSSFGSLVVAVGGFGGANGTNSAATITSRTSCVPTTSQLNIQGGAAATGGTTGTGANAVVMATSSSLLGYGGGGGGAISAATPGVEAAGGQGSRIYNEAGVLNTANVGGLASGGNGNNGVDNWALQIQLHDTILHTKGLGASGSGGGSENAGAAGRGGNGGLYGAGGGGGGGSRNGFDSGAGGDGAQGIVIIYEFLV